MRVVCGFDHAGVPLRGAVIDTLTHLGHEVDDLGTTTTDPVDYPDVAVAVAAKLLSGSAERGVLVCGSGAGVSIAANKLDGIRAAAVEDHYTAHQAVEHDGVNILCLGARVIGVEVATELVGAFVSAQFSGAERHERRLGKVAAIEQLGLEATAVRTFREGDS